jgi:glycine C-acetyltransferase
MNYQKLQSQLREELEQIQASNLYKKERLITSPQGAEILTGGQKLLNFCANNYLGLSNHPAVIAAAKKTLDQRGYGLSSVRFICGTQDIHRELECRLSEFLGTEDTILYAAAFDANGGLFEPLFGDQDAVISDELNHASIIDGIRLCKAARFRYRHNDMAELETQLQLAVGARHRIIVTDGAFSMDGTVAQLDKICELADRYEALVMVDESHCTGLMGATGRGTHEHHNVMGRIDIITGTLGKALGGASGGFTSGRKEIIELLRQCSRPYLFSNTLAPAIVGGTLEALNLLQTSSQLRDRLEENTRLFRGTMKASGFDIPTGQHPIVAVMIYDAELAAKFAASMQDEGIYVTAFSYPVVPKDKARIRVQLSAAHTRDQVNHAICAFIKTGKALGLIGQKESTN